MKPTPIPVRISQGTCVFWLCSCFFFSIEKKAYKTLNGLQVVSHDIESILSDISTFTIATELWQAGKSVQIPPHMVCAA